MNDMSKNKKRLVGAAIVLFFLYIIGKYDISGLPALLLTFGFAFVWESFVVRQGIGAATSSTSRP